MFHSSAEISLQSVEPLQLEAGSEMHPHDRCESKAKTGLRLALSSHGVLRTSMKSKIIFGDGTLASGCRFALRFHEWDLCRAVDYLIQSGSAREAVKSAAPLARTNAVFEIAIHKIPDVRFDLPALIRLLEPVGSSCAPRPDWSTNATKERGANCWPTASSSGTRTCDAGVKNPSHHSPSGHARH